MLIKLIKTRRKGIVLAGGSGSRLHPITKAVSKQLLPVYDKPMIYYPLTTLMLGGIQQVLIITTPSDLHRFKELLGDGSQWGISIDYTVQPLPCGVADALIIAEEFLECSPCVLILGDNIFFGNELSKQLELADNQDEGATIFTYHVTDPHRYGIIELDLAGNPVSIEEKPDFPKSNCAVTGLYYFDADASKNSRLVSPSRRGELEITDVLNIYAKKSLLKVKSLGRGYAWLDTGTPDGLIDAANFIAIIQKRQGLQIACPEEIAYKNGWICSNKVLNIAKQFKSNSYGDYLLNLVSR
jgi:glucose-1-phosphate thymidylyltransferase